MELKTNSELFANKKGAKFTLFICWKNDKNNHEICISGLWWIGALRTRDFRDSGLGGSVMKDQLLAFVLKSFDKIFECLNSQVIMRAFALLMIKVLNIFQSLISSLQWSKSRDVLKTLSLNFVEKKQTLIIISLPFCEIYDNSICKVFWQFWGPKF